MQHDEVIWSVINHHFCSYKVKTKTSNFCKNEYNVTGLCSRQACPLANSRYATIKEDNGILYLYQKTIERAHSPAKMWERVKLSKNYAEALKQIDENMLYWPQFLKHKCKQRLTKYTQYLMRMRRIALGNGEKLIPIKKKTERREHRREIKAETAAKLEQSIEKELLGRLKDGAYGNMYEGIMNLNKNAFDNALEEVEEESEEEEFIEEMSDEDISDLEDMEKEYELSDQDLEMLSDIDEASENDSDGSDATEKPKKSRGPRVEIEYEQELESSSRVPAVAKW